MKQYLEKMDYFQREHCRHKHSLERFVLENGIWMKPRKCPSSIKPGELKNCFRNAWRLCMSNPKYTYVEGIAQGCVIPCHHAWVLDERGRVIDNTWLKKADAMLGVPLSFEWVQRVLIERGYYGCLCDQWGWKVASGEIPPEVWKP